jgi:alpha-L-fucosidase
MTMGNSWSYVPNDKYKSARKIIHMLTDIVSKNGNLLLNIGPGPDGEWDPVAYQRLQEIGVWMKINSEAIYDTEADPQLPWQHNWVFTKKGKTIYAIYQVAENEKTNGAFSLRLPLLKTAPGIHLLGSTQNIKPVLKNGELHFQADPLLLDKQSAAWVFALSL